MHINITHKYLLNNFLLIFFSFDFVEVFEVACKIQQDIVMHPFAFRTHTHKLGK
jgi:hypothetical protein